MTDPSESEVEPAATPGVAATSVYRAPGTARQRPLAAIVVVAAVLVVVGLTAGPWAQTTFSGDGDQVLELDLDPSGSVHVRAADDGAATDLVRAYQAADNQVARDTLEEAIPGTSGELARVLAVLVAVVGCIGLLRDLTLHSWVLVAALAIGCLVVVVMLRDEVIADLATGSTAMGFAESDTEPTFWGGLAVGAAAVAALASGFAAAPRPASNRAAMDSILTEAEVAAGQQGRRRRRRRLTGGKASAPHNTF